jgi:Icc-related predicted phosphoesterase
MARILRLVAFSDTHNLHEEVTLPDGDLLLFSGDLSKRGSRKDVARFNDYLARQPHRHKVVVAGNHDFCFENHPDESRALLTAAIYLQDQAVELDGLRLYGSPWQPEFHDWAFNLERGEPLRLKWELIPPRTDVLITHGPPRGHGDALRRGGTAGCDDLLDAVRRVQPCLHVFGHIHEGYGATHEGRTLCLNASTCTFDHDPTNPPWVVELEQDEDGQPWRVVSYAPAGPLPKPDDGADQGELWPLSDDDGATQGELWPTPTRRGEGEG